MHFPRFGSQLLSAAAGFFILTGCSSTSTSRTGTRVQDQEGTYAEICRIGRTVKRAEGRLRIRVKRGGSSFALPADILVSGDPRTLALEISNPLGGTEARIRGDRDHYTILRAGESGPGKVMDAWEGIPLRVVHELLLGWPPCPQGRWLEPQDEESLRIGFGVGEELGFVLKPWQGKPWVERLRWKTETGREGEVRLSEPESGTGAPLQWQAKSGDVEVEIFWRSRRVN